MATATTRTAASTAIYDEGLRTYFSNIFLAMAFGLVVTGIVSQVVVHDSALLALFIEPSKDGPSLSGLWWFLTIAEFGVVMWISAKVRDPNLTLAKGMVVFAVYSAFNGLTLSPILHLYTQASVLNVFLISASAFGASALWGHTTKRDITGLGAFLMVGLLGLIGAMVINIFLGSPAVDFVISAIGVLLFAGLTAWDMQKLREMYDQDGNTVGLVLNGALALYLDFINLFLFFLRIFGDMSSSD